MGAGLKSIRRGGIGNYASATVLIVLGTILPVWLLVSTNYVVTDRELLVRTGPFSWDVPLHDIESVTETRNSRSSPALSLDRLRIAYGGGRVLMISPRDKDQFVQALKIDQEKLQGDL